MQRLVLLALLIGTVIGLTLQSPVASAMAPGHQAMAGGMAGSMADNMAGSADMASMPDCMAASGKQASHKPCDCGMAGCVAAASSAPAVMLANGPALIAIAAPADRDDRIGASAALPGRSTAPEPEPPSSLI